VDNEELRITPAPLLPTQVERSAADLQAIPDSQRPVELPDNAHWEKLSVYEQVRWLFSILASNAELAAKLLPYFIQIFIGYTVGNWKTTVTAVVGALCAVLSHYGVVIPQELQMPIVAITLAVVGMVAGDAKKGETK